MILLCVVKTNTVVLFYLKMIQIELNCICSKSMGYKRFGIVKVKKTKGYLTMCEFAMLSICIFSCLH